MGYSWDIPSGHQAWLQNAPFSSFLFPIEKTIYIVYTLWLFNIAMENGPFIDDFPIKTSIYKGFSMATRMLNNQMVYIYRNFQLAMFDYQVKPWFFGLSW